MGRGAELGSFCHDMNAATLLLCFVLLICGQACKHQITASEQAKYFQCEKLVDQMIVAESDFVVALKAVRDLETAKGSAAKIRDCAVKFDGLSEEFGRLGPLAPALRAQMLKKLDMAGRRASAKPHENVRVFTPDEDKIITPAAEMFFEKLGALTKKSGLYYTSAEYEKSRAELNSEAVGSQPTSSKKKPTSPAPGSRR